MTTYRHFTSADWQRLERDWCAWWNGELTRPLVVIETLTDGKLNSVWEAHFLTYFGLETPAEDVLDHFQPWLDNLHFIGDAFPKWWVNFGAGVVAAFLGSAVEYATGTTWFHPMDGLSLAEIQIEYDAGSAWWQRTLELTGAAAARWGSQMTIGMTDLGGNLDILASLRGTQQLLLDLYDAPEEVTRLTRDITAVWLRYYDALDAVIAPTGKGSACWGPCWSPRRGYMLQSDFSYMISPEMFERWVLPDLETCCAALDYPFYHLDGKGALRHLDRLLSISKLRGIQWQPGDGQPLADQWLPVLKRIREAGKLCQVYVTRAGARTICRELGGQGFLFYIVNDPITPPEAEAFVEEMHAW